MLQRHDWRPLYPFASRYVEMDGQRMHYLDEGRLADDGSALLFVHGNPTWSFLWRDFIRAWRGSHRCIAIDHIGMGLSDKPQEYSYDLNQHAENLARLLEHLDLKNITLLAHDWGGAIGLLAATMETERFSRLVLFNTGAFPPPSVPHRIAWCKSPRFGRFMLRRMNAFAIAAQFMASSNPRGLDRGGLDGLIAPYDSFENRVGIEGFVNDIPLDSSHPTHAVLTNLELGLSKLSKLPTMLGWGMKDWCFTPECLRRFDDHFPDATVRRYADAGHWVTEDATQQVIEDVEAFFAAYPLESMANRLRNG